MIYLMERDFTNGMMEEDMRENGLKAICTERGSLHGLMEDIMRVIFSTIRNTEKGNLGGMKRIYFTRDNLQTINHLNKMIIIKINENKFPKLIYSF